MKTAHDRNDYPFDDTDLSSHMEDYLETIAVLAQRTGWYG